MGLREPNSLVGEWLEAGWLLGIGVAGVLLVLNGLKRDDILRPVFVVSGMALAAFGFGSQFLGWKF